VAEPLSQLRSATRASEKRTDVRVTGAELFLLPVRTRVPLKFGAETLESVTCARVKLHVCDRSGRTASGWGETPLSVQWAWPAELSHAERYDAMLSFCNTLASVWPTFDSWGHPIEVGDAFIQSVLPKLRQQFNEGRDARRRLPLLAALVCLSAFDIALHDAYGMLHNVPIYTTYNCDWMNRDLSSYLEPAEDTHVCFKGLYPQDFFANPSATRLLAWHLVGGLDPLERGEMSGHQIHDGHPVVLDDWIEQDGLRCMKIKLRGNDSEWDFQRIVRVGKIAIQRGVPHISTDFNCTVTDPAYVNDILDRLAAENPDVDRLLLYVEQPFPYELEDFPIDVRKVAQRKPLFMDESAHSWQQVRLGRKLGWTGVALKTCKTQTGALLALCWAKAHGMQIMVQDLTNPMLAQIPHLSFAAHAGTIMGVETNSMQFYPQASAIEAKFHPGLFSRVDGHVDLSTIHGAGFGYNGAPAARVLPAPAVSHVAKVPFAVPHWHIGRR
jgi:L-alanine-DL-glutamate epimerase-like enolase superfamily enzyme